MSWWNWFDTGGGDEGGGGGEIDLDQYPKIRSILSPEQQDEIVSRLLSFNDTPNQPLGTQSRDVIMQRLQPGYVPQFFRPETLNPFLQAQFRLGREQLERDVTKSEDQFQRLGAFFSPDLPAFTQRLRERQNLSEQDYLGNLGFQGATLAESLRTDALARALGLETQTAGVLDQLLGRQQQIDAANLGFQSNIIGYNTDSTQMNRTDPTGFLTALLSDQLFNRVPTEGESAQQGASFFPGGGGGGGMFGGSGGGSQGGRFNKEDHWWTEALKIAAAVAGTYYGGPMGGKAAYRGADIVV